MKEDQLISMNKITMYVWLGCGILGLLLAAYYYFSEIEGLKILLMVSLICFMMFFWKRFQIAKFGSPRN